MRNYRGKKHHLLPWNARKGGERDESEGKGLTGK